jgi:hypothetical protein
MKTLPLIMVALSTLLHRFRTKLRFQPIRLLYQLKVNLWTMALVRSSCLITHQLADQPDTGAPELSNAAARLSPEWEEWLGIENADVPQEENDIDSDSDSDEDDEEDDDSEDEEEDSSEEGNEDAELSRG